MSTELDIAVAAARAAGARQREALQAPRAVHTASRMDIKLHVDTECEAIIRDILWDARPEFAVLGEEGGGTVATDAPTWIVDPLDGTVNYFYGIPYFCTSIALQYNARTLLGVVYNPLLDELFTAEEGGGAWRNGQRISVSATTEIIEAIFAIGGGKTEQSKARMLDTMREMAATARRVRLMGAAALDLAYVAAGHFDGFIEHGLSLWDIAAGILLVREAGGRVAADLDPNGAWDVRADNGRLPVG